MSYSPARQQVIEQLGARSADEAIRTVEAAPETGAHPREKRALLALLNGETVREVSAAIGVSQVRTLQLIRRAARDVVRMRGADSNARSLFERLSNRSRTSLYLSGLDTDEKVQRLVDIYGASSLLTLDTLGVDRFKEICDAFGFDPDEEMRPPELSDTEARSFKATRYHRRKFFIRDRILTDERIFPKELEADPAPDHQTCGASEEDPSP